MKNVVLIFLLVSLFKGTDSPDDWMTNLGIGMDQDSRWCGQIHGGFLKKAGYVSISDIAETVMINGIKNVIVTGHSLGGAVSSLVHLKLLKYFEELDEKPTIQNLTFGSPMFGNFVLEENLREQGYIDDMYHFASTADIIPAILSTGHAFNVFKNHLGVLGQTALSWFQANQNHFGNIEKMILCLNNAMHTAHPNKSTTLNVFLKSYEHLKNSMEYSNLSNNFSEIDFVPIGKFLLLQKQQNGKHQTCLLEDKKLVERIIQAAVEYQFQEVTTLISDHLLNSYLHKIKDTLNGLKQFGTRKLKPYSDDMSFLMASNFLVETVSRYFCGFDNCNECERIPFYDQHESLVKQLTFCRTCQMESLTMEPYFHESCSNKFHGTEENADHDLHKVDLSKIHPSQRRDFFIESNCKELEVYQETAAKVGKLLPKPLKVHIVLCKLERFEISQNEKANQCLTL